MNLYEIKTSEKSPKPHTVDQLQFVPGIWIEGRYYWLQSCMEKVIYEEEIVLCVKQVQIHSKIRLSNIYVSNHSDKTKEIKIMVMHHYPNPTHEQLTFISPSESRIFHLANKNVYMVNAQYQGQGLKDYTTISQWKMFTDQIWSSLRKGTLCYQPLAKGLAASIFTISMTIKPHETSKMTAWSISGRSKKEVISLEEALFKNRLAFPFEK